MEPKQIVESKRSLHKNATFEDYGIKPEPKASKNDGFAGSTGGKTADRTGGKTAGSTGGKTTGSTGGETAGSTGGKTTGSTGGKTEGSTGGKTTGSTGGNTTGTTGGTPEKKTGSCCLGKLLKWIFIAFIVYLIAYGIHDYIQKNQKPESESISSWYVSKSGNTGSNNDNSGSGSSSGDNGRWTDFFTN